VVEKGGNLVPSDEQIVITADHVVTASGNHAQRTAKMLGIKMPAIPVEHQFIVMDQDPALVEVRQNGGVEHPVVRDADAQSYVREERGGWILGVYEKNAPAVFEHGVPDSFRADLFQLDLERIEEQYMAMIHRIPSCVTATRWWGRHRGCAICGWRKGFPSGSRRLAARGITLRR